MLDHAFGIFNNVSPRFQWAEIDLPFPSDDRFFEVASYAELRAQSLYPIPKMKVKDAYVVLFTPPESAEQELNVLRTGNLTPLDMQMLIHCKSTETHPQFLFLIFPRFIYPRMEKHIFQPHVRSPRGQHPRNSPPLPTRHAQLAYRMG